MNTRLSTYPVGTDPKPHYYRGVLHLFSPHCQRLSEVASTAAAWAHLNFASLICALDTTSSAKSDPDDSAKSGLATSLGSPVSFLAPRRNAKLFFAFTCP